MSYFNDANVIDQRNNQYARNNSMLRYAPEWYDTTEFNIYKSINCMKIPRNVPCIESMAYYLSAAISYPILDSWKNIYFWRAYKYQTWDSYLNILGSFSRCKRNNLCTFEMRFANILNINIILYLEKPDQTNMKVTSSMTTVICSPDWSRQNERMLIVFPMYRDECFMAWNECEMRVKNMHAFILGNMK